MTAQIDALQFCGEQKSNAHVLDTVVTTISWICLTTKSLERFM